MRVALYSDYPPLLLFFLLAIEARIDWVDWASYRHSGGVLGAYDDQSDSRLDRLPYTVYECVE
jgi:hypothetical protein